MDKYFNTYREMISLRGLTDHTLKSYSTYIRNYLDYLQNTLNKLPEDVSWQDLRDYIKWLQKNVILRTEPLTVPSRSFVSLPFMFCTNLGTTISSLNVSLMNIFLLFLPKETFEFIRTIPDIKQKAMVAVMYSSGLRIGEVCHLRYEDINRNTMKVHICKSKNRQERFAPLSKFALDILTMYWFECGRPKEWLFPKQTDPTRPIDTFFLSRHIHEHEERLGWPKRITCHSFRHALGTHLYENGTDLLTIKAILGHKSLNSTTIYVHLASTSFSDVINPLDQMGGVSNVSN